MTEEMIVREFFEIPLANGIPLRGDLRYFPGHGRRAVVIICHSFMAFKDWGFFPRIGTAFAAEGYASIVFNFTGNGVVGDGKRITEFKRFEENTISAEVRDLEILVEAVRSGQIGSSIIDPARIILLGHSRGGGIAIIVASEAPGIWALVTLASVSRFQRWSTHQMREWRERGHLPLARDSAKSPLRLGIGLLDDLESNDRRFDLLRSSASLRMPWLIVHGIADVTVPPSEAEALFAAAGKTNAQLLMVEHAGHLFHAQSPEEDGYRTLDGIITRILQWLHPTLQKESSWNRNQPQLPSPSS